MEGRETDASAGTGAAAAAAAAGAGGQQHSKQVLVPRELGEPLNMHDMMAIGDKEKGLLPLLVGVLDALVQRNDRDHSVASQAMSAFHASSPPRVALSDYVERIRRYSGCSPCCFVIAVILMDRYFQHSPTFVLSSLSIHRIVLTSVLVASKFLDDFYYNNAFWAKVGGVQRAELNALELELLFRVRFNLHVMREEYAHYRQTLLHTAETSQAPPRPLRAINGQNPTSNGNHSSNNHNSGLEVNSHTRNEVVGEMIMPLSPMSRKKLLMMNGGGGGDHSSNNGLVNGGGGGYNHHQHATTGEETTLIRGGTRFKGVPLEVEVVAQGMGTMHVAAPVSSTQPSGIVC